MTLYMFSHAYNLVYSLEYEQLVLSEPTNLQNGNDKLEFQRLIGFYPPPIKPPRCFTCFPVFKHPEKHNAKPSKTGCNLSIKAIFAQCTQQICLWQCTGQGAWPRCQWCPPDTVGSWSLPWSFWWLATGLKKRKQQASSVCTFYIIQNRKFANKALHHQYIYIIMIHDDTSYTLHKNSFSLWPESRATTIQHLGWKKRGFKGLWDMPRSTTSRPKHVFISKQKLSLAT